MFIIVRVSSYIFFLTTIHFIQPLLSRGKKHFFFFNKKTTKMNSSGQIMPKCYRGKMNVKIGRHLFAGSSGSDASLVRL